jgi:DNA-binding CsgD family transcriptional regulator
MPDSTGEHARPHQKMTAPPTGGKKADDGRVLQYSGHPILYLARMHKRYPPLQARADPAAAEEPEVQLLRAAVLAVEKARAATLDQSTRGAREWQGLVDARWSLVESFMQDGRRYVVAREAAPQRLDLGSLTLRERQIVGFACLGRDNKVIAYDLGIAHSTVKVLMARAAAKLGAGSRDELIATFRARWHPVPGSTQPEITPAGR